MGDDTVWADCLIHFVDYFYFSVSQLIDASLSFTQVILAEICLCTNDYGLPEDELFDFTMKRTRTQVESELSTLK